MGHRFYAENRGIQVILTISWGSGSVLNNANQVDERLLIIEDRFTVSVLRVEVVALRLYLEKEEGFKDRTPSSITKGLTLVTSRIEKSKTTVWP